MGLAPEKGAIIQGELRDKNKPGLAIALPAAADPCAEVTGHMAYWLFKSEPDDFSIDDLQALGSTPEPWDGIRNYQARNLLRDAVAEGDEVLIYHSSCKQVGVAGTAKVVRAAYPDPDQFDPQSKYFDPKASADNVRWYCVDVVFASKFPRLVPLQEIKAMPGLENMMLLKQGRLSIQPVTGREWATIVAASETDT